MATGPPPGGSSKEAETKLKEAVDETASAAKDEGAEADDTSKLSHDLQNLSTTDVSSLTSCQAAAPQPARVDPSNVTKGMVLDPTQSQVFRGGPGLEARSGIDVKPAADGLIHPTEPNKKGQPGTKPQGLSVNIDPTDRFIVNYGGPHRVVSVPEGLQVVQSGKTNHFVIAPSHPMEPATYQGLLNQVVLEKVE